MGSEEKERVVGTKLRELGLRIERLLGEGSYARVYLAIPTNSSATTDLPHRIAVKALHLDTLKTKMVTHFVPRELKILQDLSHPNLIRTYKVLEVPAPTSLALILTEVADGGNLLSRVRRERRIPQLEARRIFLQLSDALYYLHSRFICHRDLKCENVLFDCNGDVKLCDFGFARVQLPTEADSRTFCGSAAYAAPEVLQSKPYRGIHADLWSLGVITYIALTGLMPFDDRDLPRMIRRQLRHDVSFSQYPDLSTHAKALVRALLHPTPLCRPPHRRILAFDWLRSTPPSPSPLHLHHSAPHHHINRIPDHTPDLPT